MKKSGFKKFLLIYIFILILLSIGFLFYTYNSLVLYDNNDPENFIMKNLENGEISKYYDGDKKALTSYYKENEIKVSLVSNKDDSFIYGVYNDEELITSVELKEEKSFTRLLIFTIKNWSIKDVQYKFEKGLYSYNILIPSNYKLYLDDKEYTTYQESSESTFDRIKDYDKDLVSKLFEIKDLNSKPNIVIKDNNNKEVNYELKGNKIEVKNEYKTVKYSELNKKTEIDVMEIAKNWSLFLTKDLSGVNNGLPKFTPYLIKDSYMESLAKRWARGPEIYDVTEHGTPTFKNEEIVGCTVYTDNTFSCEVKLDKTFRLTKSGQYRTDSMHEAMFFTYYEDGYKLTDMQSLGNN